MAHHLIDYQSVSPTFVKFELTALNLTAGLLTIVKYFNWTWALILSLTQVSGNLQ